LTFHKEGEVFSLISPKKVKEDLGERKQMLQTMLINSISFAQITMGNIKIFLIKILNALIGVKESVP
jgi:hypothetical protein